MSARSLGWSMVGLVFALHVPPAHAVLVDHGLTTLDTASGLEWLDMNQSVGLSAQSIISGTDPSQLGAAGWQHATLLEINTLLLDAGLTAPFNGSLTPANFPSAASLISLLGPTGGASPGFIQAFAGEGPLLGILFTPVVLAVEFAPSSGVGGADLPGPGVPQTVVNPTIGSWLVRSAVAVPEPSSLLLLGSGLAMLGARGLRGLRRA